MKRRFTTRAALFILISGVMLFTSATVITGKYSAGTSKKKKMYISSIKSNDVRKQLVDRIRNGITLSILDNYSSVYQVLDDEAVKVMYAQAEKIMASGCTDESCMTQIADGINADEIVYGEVSYDGGMVKLVMKSLVRKGMELENKAIVYVSFKESQTDWFAAETGKKLIDPRYKIDPTKAPQEFDAKIEIQGISIGGVESFNIKVMKFTTNDEQIQNILGYLKELVQSGDELFTNRKYNESLDKYKTVVERIDTKLRPESKEKIKTFRDEAISRIDTTYAMLYKMDMERIDAKLKGQDETDETFLNKIISQYTDLKSDMKKKTQREFYGENTVKIEKAIEGRVDSCILSICGLHEKLGDTSYSSYSFDKALEEYNKSLSAAGRIAGPDKSRVEERYISKISTTYKTGRSYLENKVKSYTDLAEFYNVKDETSKAKNMIKDARKLMTGGMAVYVTGAAIQNYNSASSLLGMEQITEESEPDLFRRIAEDERKRYEADISGIKRRGEYRNGFLAKFGNMEFILITGSTYTMGSPDSESNRDRDEKQHRVTVSPFWIGKYEVTQSEYENIMGTNPSYFTGSNLPVETVSWYDAVEFCNRLSKKSSLKPYYNIDKSREDPDNTNDKDHIKWRVTIAGGHGFRLPTEAEWEYACREGTTTPFHYGTGRSLESSMANFDGNNPYNARRGIFREKVTAVGSFKPNPYGLYDMHGNVWEWCWDWYGEGYYDNSPVNDPQGANNGSFRVLRGGSWVDYGDVLRSANRDRYCAGDKGVSLGFRVVRSAN